MATAALLAACTTAPPPLTLSEDQSREVDQIGRYLDGLKSFEARFAQAGAFGGGSGTVWLDRPGRLRIQYAGSTAKTVVANRGIIVITDPATGGTTTTPVARTPLSMLLAPAITLSGPITVTAYREQPGLVTLTIKKTTAPDDGALTLFLNPFPLALTGVVLTDGYQRDLVMQLSDLRTNPSLPSDLFQYPAS